MVRHIVLAEATPRRGLNTPTGPLITVRGLESKLLRSAAATSSGASVPGGGQRTGDSAAGRARTEEHDVLYEVEWQAAAPSLLPVPASVVYESGAAAAAATVFEAGGHLQLLQNSSATTSNTLSLSPSLVALVASSLVTLNGALSSKLNVGLTTTSHCDSCVPAMDLSSVLAAAGLHALMRTLMQVRSSQSC
jgi:hypothetical protein